MHDSYLPTILMSSLRMIYLQTHREQVNAVDQDKDGMINREEFHELCVLLPMSQREQAEKRSRRSAAAAAILHGKLLTSCTRRCCPGFHGSERFR